MGLGELWHHTDCINLGAGVRTRRLNRRTRLIENMNIDQS